jgi:hypothetical protein
MNLTHGSAEAKPDWVGRLIAHLQFAIWWLVASIWLNVKNLTVELSLWSIFNNSWSIAWVAIQLGVWLLLHSHLPFVVGCLPPITRSDCYIREQSASLALGGPRKLIAAPSGNHTGLCHAVGKGKPFVPHGLPGD